MSCNPSIQWLCIFCDMVKPKDHVVLGKCVTCRFKNKRMGE